MKQLFQYTDPKYMKTLSSMRKYDSIEELAFVFDGSPVCDDAKSLADSLKEREKMMSTGIGFGIAIPHAKIEGVHHLAFAVGVSPTGIEFDSMDGKPVRLMVLVAAGESQHDEYLELLSAIMLFLKAPQVIQKILSAEKPEDIFAIIKETK